MDHCPLHQAPTKAQQSLVVGKQVFISGAKNMDFFPSPAGAGLTPVPHPRPRPMALNLGIPGPPSLSCVCVYTEGTPG